MGKWRDFKRSSLPDSPYTRPATGATTKRTFKCNTNIGQHILRNSNVADAIVSACDIHPTHSVLEIGPGTGILTTRILDKAKAVVAVEVDPRMTAELTKLVQVTSTQRRLQIISGDFVKLDLNGIPPVDRCISNTPYQISSQLVFKLLAMRRPPRVRVLMVQREFALRLMARPGDALYSRLSVNVQFFARVSHLMRVGKGSFVPPPEVESSVVKLEPKSDRPAISWDEWDGMLRICFGRKNKLLRANFQTKDIRGLVERNWLSRAVLHPDQVCDRDKRFLQDSGSCGGIDLMESFEDPGDASDSEIEVSRTGRKQFSDPVNTHLAVCGIWVTSAVLAGLAVRKIQLVFEKTELGTCRASKCDENDFLRLLLEFNEEGIHFH